MIYFYPELVAKTVEGIKEVIDFTDVSHDIERIKAALAGVQQFGDTCTAQKLDDELRKKYATIEEMIEIANVMRPIQQQRFNSFVSESPEESNLKQDYYGIICHVAMKKGIVKDIKELIKCVD